MMHTIYPCIWLNNEAEAMVQRYKEIFVDVVVHTTIPYIVDTPSNKEVGSVMTIDFEIFGCRFMALNGGEYFTPTPAISFMLHCTEEEEVDRLYAELSKDGKTLMPLDAYPFSKRYAWVEDAFGVSWQLMFVEEHREQKIVPCMLFMAEDGPKAERAMNFYTETIKGFGNKILKTSHYEDGQEPNTKEMINYGLCEIRGQEFVTMDSGITHGFTFTEGVSFILICGDDTEMNYYYKELSADPNAEMCGWVKDQFGVSWQLTPKDLDEVLSGPRAQETMNALLEMRRLDMDQLRAIHHGTN